MDILLKKSEVLDALTSAGDVTGAKIVEDIPGISGNITKTSTWEKIQTDDPRMDDTERMLYPDEVYCCTECGTKDYFGASCQKGRYCQHCGSYMINAGMWQKDR